MLVFKLLAIFVILTSTWTVTIATPTHSLSNRFETLLNQLSHDNCKPDLGNLNVFFHSGSDGQPFVAQLNVSSTFKLLHMCQQLHHSVLYRVVQVTG